MAGLTSPETSSSGGSAPLVTACGTHRSSGTASYRDQFTVMSWTVGVAELVVEQSEVEQRPTR